MSYLGNKSKDVLRKYFRRKHRINTVLKSTATLPRVIVEKSNSYIKAQVVALDGAILATIWDKKSMGSTKSEKAYNAGKTLAEILKKTGTNAVAFDRNGYLYHGRVKSFADGIREGGINL